MNLTDMRTIVRRDLHDEDSNNYRWTDNEIDRHIARAVKAFSGRLPLEQKAVLATVDGSREMDITGITGRVMVEAVEYPSGKFPPVYQSFSLWGDTLTLVGDDVPDGSNAAIYYGQLHTLDTSSSTIPAQHEDLIAAGVAGFAAEEWAVYAINKVNPGGNAAPQELLAWANQKLKFFRQELRRLGRQNRVRVNTLYSPLLPIVTRNEVPGP
jgi:hypothetical protein